MRKAIQNSTDWRSIKSRHFQSRSRLTERRSMVRTKTDEVDQFIGIKLVNTYDESIHSCREHLQTTEYDPRFTLTTSASLSSFWHDI